jgi:hypothetical protein
MSPGAKVVIGLSTLITLSALAGCSEDTAIGMVPDAAAKGIRGVDAGATDGTVTSPDSARPDDAAEPPYTVPTEVVGAWTGYFENFTLFSGSDAVSVSLVQPAGGPSRIEVTLGLGPVPPPPTSPTEYWPANRKPSPSDPFDPGTPRYIEGFRYAAHDVRWQGLRLTFKLATYEAWQPWCEMQTAFQTFDIPGYNCMPGWGGGYTFDEDKCDSQDRQGTQVTEVPCGQFLLCDGMHCQCDVAGCFGGTERTVSFDITFDPGLNRGDGSVLLEGAHTLRLTRTAM